MTTRTKKSPEARVEGFNQANPVGTKVLYKRHTSDPSPLATATRTEAWVLSGHTAVVMVEGVAGCVGLDFLVVFPNEPITPKYPGGMVGGIPAFNKTNTDFVEESNAAPVRVGGE